jgi:threonine dehydratase
VICGVGGGGLASGLGLAAARSGRMTVIGVESDASLAVSTAIRAGRVTRSRSAPRWPTGWPGTWSPARSPPA